MTDLRTAASVATVSECEACMTPDACQLRGTCDYYSAERLRVVRPSAPSQQPLTDAAADVLLERERQINGEGWTHQHDDERAAGELAAAGISYALVAACGLWPSASGNTAFHKTPPGYWPWDVSSWKPMDPRRNLVKAAALLLAEIERMDRAFERAHGIGGTND